MRAICRLAFGLLALLIAGSPEAQSNYPEKPIRLVVGFPPGSTVDIVARLLGQQFAQSLGQPVMVENVPGAAGNIATDRAAKASPDGYTLTLVGSGQILVNPSLYQVAYDPVKDFAPVSQVCVIPTILVVHNAVPARTVMEVVALAKAQPGALTFATSGSGSPPHIAGELLKSMAGIDIRDVPYKGVPAAIPDLLSGRVTMMFSPMSAVLPLVREGKLRALAVTSLKRSATLPQLPTIDESGFPGFEVTLWFGLLAPARTPTAIIGKLHLETMKILQQADVRTKLADLGYEVIGNSPDEFATEIKSELPRWARLIRESRIKPD